MKMARLKTQKTTLWDEDHFFNEISAIKNAIGEFISQYVCGRTHVECFRDIVCGQIIHKKVKGCSYFYKLLSLHDKKDGWDAAFCSMERDLRDFDPSYIF